MVRPVSGPPIRGAPAEVLARVDRAAFVSALGRRLRRAGLVTDSSRLQSLAQALSVVHLDSRADLYWAARITLVRHPRDLVVFDAVFRAVFEDTVLAMDPHARRQSRADTAAASAPSEQDGWTSPPGRGDSEKYQQDGQGLPWLTRPPMTPDDETSPDDDGLFLAEPSPSAAEGLSGVPFDELDPTQLEVLGQWLESSLSQWPSRRTRRAAPHARGRRIDLRATLSRSRATGFEPVHLVRSKPSRVRRPMVMLCDVSRSMQAYTQVYVHLMRAAAVTARAEVFAFSTEIMRLTAALGPHSLESPQASTLTAVQRAAEQVAGSSPGTRIGHSLRGYLGSRQGSMARGAIVIIASDGWDADDPAELEAAMIRLHRRARFVIWLNPRCAATGYEPLTGAMSVALPYCDRVLPGHTINAMHDVVTAIIEAGR